MKKNSAQETLLFPLIGRIRANQRWPEYFNDSYSKTVIKKFDENLIKEKDMGDFPAIMYGLRYKKNVDIARNFIKEHPNCTIVNLGAGLDSLFDDIDNGKIKYYSLDFPEVIDLRNKYLPTSDRNINIAGSITETEWLDRIDAKGEDGVLFLAAGVIYYLHVKDMKVVIREMGKKYKACVFSFDSESPFFMKKSNKMVKKKGIEGAEMHFMVKNPYLIKDWSEDIESIKIETDFLSCLKESSKLPLMAKSFFFFIKFRPNIYQLTIKYK